MNQKPQNKNCAAAERRRGEGVAVPKTITALPIVAARMRKNGKATFSSTLLIAMVFFISVVVTEAATIHNGDDDASILPTTTVQQSWWPWFSLVPRRFQEWYFHAVVSRLLALSIFMALAYSMGWFHRLVWYLAEREASKLLNYTPVTIGSLEFDLMRGRFAATNVILHAPQYTTYRWSAPIVARVGHVHVECNVVRCLLSLWLLWQETPIELYTVHVSDIQVFVERKYNVYNFLLLDPHVVVVVQPPQAGNAATAVLDETNTPPVPTTAAAAAATSTTKTSILDETEMDERRHRFDSSHGTSIISTNDGDGEDGDGVVEEVEATMTEHPLPQKSPTSNSSSSTNEAQALEPASAAATTIATTRPPPPVAVVEQEAARLVVDQIVHAVKKAAQHSGGNPTALWDECRHSLSTHLKQWRDGSGGPSSVNATDAVGTTFKSTTPSATAASAATTPSSHHSLVGSHTVSQGLSVLKHLTAHLTATTTQAHSIVVPERRKGDKIVYGRVGRVVLANARIFVKDSSNTVVATEAIASSPLPSKSKSSHKSKSVDENNKLASLGWNRPIVIARVVIRPHEFCPPRTVSDDHPPQWFHHTNGNSGMGSGTSHANSNHLGHESSTGTTNSTSTPIHEDDPSLEDDHPYTSPSFSSHHHPHLPALYQPLPQCVDVVIQRVLAEIAKSNSGRLLQTALGEMADVLATASSQAAAAAAVANAATAAAETPTPSAAAVHKSLPKSNTNKKSVEPRPW